MVHYTLIHTCKKKRRLTLLDLDNTKNTRIKAHTHRSRSHEYSGGSKEEKNEEEKRKTKERSKERSIQKKKETIDQTSSYLKRQPGNGWWSWIGDERKKVGGDVTQGERRGNSMPTRRLTHGRRNGSSSFPRRYFTRHSFFSVSSRRFIVPLILATGNQPRRSLRYQLFTPILDQRIRQRVVRGSVARLSMLRAKFMLD